MSLIDRKITKELHKIDNSLKIKYAAKFQSIVNLFCSANLMVEWSGVLFYRIDSAENRDLHITLLDIQLMDIGSSGFTSYDFDGSIGELGAKYLFSEDAGNVHMGHIHSHNNMDVFFSGTDNQELIDNSDEHFMYLSVIVNNKLDIIARAVIKEEVTYNIQASGSILFKDATKQIKYPATVEKGVKLWYYEAEFEPIASANTIDIVDLYFYLESLRNVKIKQAEKKALRLKQATKTQTTTKMLPSSDMSMSNDFTLVKELLVDATHLVGKNQNSIAANITMSISSEMPIKEIARKTVSSLIDLLTLNNVDLMVDCLQTAKSVVTQHVYVYPNVQMAIIKEIDSQIEQQDLNIHSVLDNLFK